MKKPLGSLISYFSSLTAKQGGINMAQGKPGFSPPPELLRLLREKSKIMPLHQYAPGNGHPGLLDLLASRYSEYSVLGDENLVIVQGATEGIFLTLFYLNTILPPPYSILSFDPVYESYPELARFLSKPFIYQDLEPDLSLNFKKLERSIKNKNVKIVLLASPGNPLGKIWSKAEMMEMIELSGKLDFYLVFDGVYMDIHFYQPAFNPLETAAPFLEGSRLFYVSSFSKMLSITGWRIGFVIADPNHMKRIRAIHDYTGLSAPNLFQVAIAEYWKRNDFGRKYLDSVRCQCREAFALMKASLEKLGFQVPGIQGGYFLWARLPGKYSDGFRFSLDLLEREKVGVVPGENFSLTRHDHIRINIATELPVIRQGINGIESFCRQFGKKI
jgi:aspartate/methionine/tyrosine aminotransferase